MRTYDWSLHLIDSGGDFVSLHLTEIGYGQNGRAVPDRLANGYVRRSALVAELDKYVELLLERYDQHRPDPALIDAFTHSHEVPLDGVTELP